MKKVLSIALTLLVCASTSLIGSPSRGQAQGSTATASVGEGSEFAVSEGSVIAQGEAYVEGDSAMCLMPKTSLILTGDVTVAENGIIATVTDSCELVVTSIWQTPADSSSTLLSTRYQSGGGYKHLDVIGLVLTMTYADMYYYDDGSSVYSGSNANPWCHVALDGWGTNWSAWDWNPMGYSSVSIWNECNFDFYGSYNHTLDVSVYSWPGNAYNVYCDHWGSTAPGGQFSCEGAHWAA